MVSSGRYTLPCRRSGSTRMWRPRTSTNHPPGRAWHDNVHATILEGSEAVLKAGSHKQNVQIQLTDPVLSWQEQPRSECACIACCMKKPPQTKKMSLASPRHRVARRKGKQNDASGARSLPPTSAPPNPHQQTTSIPIGTLLLLLLKLQTPRQMPQTTQHPLLV